VIADLIILTRGNLRSIIGIPTLVGGIVLVQGLLAPRVFEVPLVVSPVSSRLGATSGGIAASVLGASMMGGLQSTPALVARLARLDGVLLRVAKQPVNGGSIRVIDKLRGESAGEVTDRSALVAMKEVISATADPQTGLVSVRVAATDSAMVRLISSSILTETSEAFLQASRAQATALKLAQEARLDTARRRLSEAEEAMRSFRSSNRAVTAVSSASLTEAKLRRNLTLAEDLYRRAAEERESAASRELEETPALVIVDGIPSELQPRSRGLLLRTILWSTFALVIVLMVLRARIVALKGA
jgi:hypothetical protein